MHAFRFFVDAGGLMSYGATTSEIYTMAAEQVAKILDGARPSELPLRQATRFELVNIGSFWGCSLPRATRRNYPSS
jgi:putative ABC transport system substrate-binding protein